MLLYKLGQWEGTVGDVQLQCHLGQWEGRRCTVAMSLYKLGQWEGRRCTVAMSLYINWVSGRVQ